MSSVLLDCSFSLPGIGTTVWLPQCQWSNGERNNANPPRTVINSLRPIRNKRHLADDIFKYIFLKENVWISIKISLKFVPKGPINNIPPLVLIMAWRRPGDKPLSEPMMVSLLTHICVTRSQWVKTQWNMHKNSVITTSRRNVDVTTMSLLLLLSSFLLCFVPVLQDDDRHKSKHVQQMKASWNSTSLTLCERNAGLWSFLYC